MLIMMFRPALRTSHSAFCGAASGMRTTCPGRPRSPISATRSSSRRRGVSASSPMNSTSRIASGSPTSAASMTGRNDGLLRASSIIVRSTSSTAAGPSLTMCLRQLHRPVQRREADDAERLVPGQRRELQRQRAHPGQRSFAADEQVGVIDAAVAGVRPLALRMEDVEVVAADAAHHLRHVAFDLVALAVGDGAQAVHQSAHARRRAVHSRFGAEPRLGAVGQQRVGRHARCAPCCRRRSSASRRSCCPPCRRSSPAPRC